MNIILDLTIDELQLVRMGLCECHAQAMNSARAMKNDPLEVYRNKQVADTIKALQKKITKVLDTEIKKAVDKRKEGGVS